jgi:hypothetical protein
MSLPVVVEQAARQLERSRVGPQSWASLASRPMPSWCWAPGASAAIRPGASDQPTGWPGAQRYAAQLAKASGLPVLTSGGLHYGTPPSEAQLMADRCRMISASRSLEGRASRTTWENAAQRQVLQPLGIKRVVVVTQAWHMPRSRWSLKGGV